MGSSVTHAVPLKLCIHFIPQWMQNRQFYVTPCSSVPRFLTSGNLGVGRCSDCVGAGAAQHEERNHCHRSEMHEVSVTPVLGAPVQITARLAVFWSDCVAR